MNVDTDMLYNVYKRYKNVKLFCSFVEYWDGDGGGYDEEERDAFGEEGWISFVEVWAEDGDDCTAPNDL